MKRTHQIIGCFMILLAVYVVRESQQLRFYTPLGPGPGFFPFWLGILLGLLGGIMVLQAAAGKPEPLPPDFFATKRGYLRGLAILVALAGTVGFLEVLGFRLTMLVFYLFLLTALGRQHLVTTVAVAVAGSWGVYQVFVELLKVPLPVGVFGV